MIKKEKYTPPFNRIYNKIFVLNILCAKYTCARRHIHRPSTTTPWLKHVSRVVETWHLRDWERESSQNRFSLSSYLIPTISERSIVGPQSIYIYIYISESEISSSLAFDQTIYAPVYIYIYWWVSSKWPLTRTLFLINLLPLFLQTLILPSQASSRLCISSNFHILILFVKSV